VTSNLSTSTSDSESALLHPTSAMSRSQARNLWGVPPWKIDFTPPKHSLPSSVDFAVVGAGFAGLAAAAWLRILAPGKSVVVLEAGRIGNGASGRTGGLVLSESAAGDLPGLGDVLAGLKKILRRLRVESDLLLPGAWEIAHSEHAKRSDNARPLKGSSPIQWRDFDSREIRVTGTVPGGTLDPGKQVSGLARVAVRSGAFIAENCGVHKIEWTDPPTLHLARGCLRATEILLATNALSLETAGLSKSAIQPKLTLAARTAPMRERELRKIGVAARRPFYTIDFPYLWGRVCADRSIVWGAGLVDAPNSGELEDVDVSKGRAAEMFASFEKRVHALHPALAKARFTHKWGGPIAFRENFRPVFAHHPDSANGVVLGIFAGHGVALSVYLGTWAAEALLGRRTLPSWGRIDSK
jgi:glycine/D-amino acid oxidase-like deaminating enzyme